MKDTLEELRELQATGDDAIKLALTISAMPAIISAPTGVCIDACVWFLCALYHGANLAIAANCTVDEYADAISDGIRRLLKEDSYVAETANECAVPNGANGFSWKGNKK